MPVLPMLVAAVLGLSLPAAAQQFAERAPPQVGHPFGPLVLPTVNGSQVIDLDSYRGQKVLLIEFASW